MENEPAKKRNILIRIIVAIIWLLIIMLVGNMIVGAVVGGMAGNRVVPAEGMSEAIAAGASAGRAAAQQFFVDYGHYVFLAEVVLWIGLCASGHLPGTTKYKRVAGTNNDEKESDT